MTTPDTPPAGDKTARDRLGMLIGLRAGGVMLMLLGIWLWLGGNIAGHYGFGGVLFAVGAVESLLVPRLLLKRWKSPE